MLYRSFLKRLLVMLALVFSTLSWAQNPAPDTIVNAYTGVFHPGRATFVSVQLYVEKDRDVLVDLLDKTGWYTGQRQTVKAGTDYASFTLDLPASMRDPQSAYISIKIIPVGGEWWQKFAELNLPARFITSEPIPVRLYYDFPLATFSEVLSRGISNHDGVRVFVRKNNGNYEMGYQQSGYGQEQELILNLVTGDLNYRVQNASPMSGTTTITAAVIQGDDALRQTYIQHLQKMKGTFEHVESGRMADYSADYPLLREANQYLRQVLFRLNPGTRDALDTPVLHNPAGGPYLIPRPGKKIAVKVHYEASADRELIVRLQAQGQEWASQRFKVGAGSDTLVLPLQLAPNAPTNVPAQFEVSLVPLNASLESRLAHAEQEATILPANNIDSVYVAEAVAGLADLTMSVSYATAEPLDLRVDLYGPDGTRLDRIQQPLAVTDVGSLYPLQFGVQHDLQSGRTYTVVFRLVPPGSTRENGFGDVVRFFQKREVN